jgi:hypothetical protein
VARTQLTEIVQAIVDGAEDRREVFDKLRVSEATLSRVLNNKTPGALLRKTIAEVGEFANDIGVEIGPAPAGPPREPPEPLRSAFERVETAILRSGAPSAWLEGALRAFEGVAAANRPLSRDSAG